MNSVEDNVGVGSINGLDMVVSNGSNMEVLSVIRNMLVGVSERAEVLKEGVGVGTKESGGEKESDSDETVVVRRGCCVEVKISSMLDCMEKEMEAGEDLMGETDSDKIGIDVSTDCIENTMDIIGIEVAGRTGILVPSIEVTKGRECVVIVVGDVVCIVVVDVVCIVVVADNIVGWKVRDVSEVGITLLGGTIIWEDNIVLVDVETKED